MGGSESKQEGGSDQTEETEQQSLNSTTRNAACVAGAVAAGAALLWGLSSVGAVQNNEEDHDKWSKLMKAPGRKGELMQRGKFEADPRSYFLDLRGKKN